MANALLQKIEKSRQDGIQAGLEIGMQIMIDMMCLVLNDPDVMGKGTFGATRIKTVVDALKARLNQYETTWTADPEADYYQTKLDENLKRVLGGELPYKFEERYPRLSVYDYKKGKYIR